MIEGITKQLRDFFEVHSTALKCKAGRAADREGALLWMLRHTGSAWGVCVTVVSVAPAGSVEDRRQGRAVVTLRIYTGLTPGAPADVDKRAEELHRAWHLVWSYMARVRWGTAKEGAEGRRVFLPRDGFLDGERGMVPAGSTEFTRVALQIPGPGGKTPAQDLLLCSQDWQVQVALPVVGPALPGAGADTNLYLN